MATPGEVTQLLIDWSSGDRMALDRLMPIVYKELRRLAASRLRRQPQEQTLQATALVHEAYLRIVNWKDINWQNRAHFFGLAAQLMRNILVDRARNRLSTKRGGGTYRLSFDAALKLSGKPDVDLVALDDALTSLAAIDQRQSRIIELRFFGGLTFEEVAEVLQVSPATVSREWNLAKIWLLHEIKRSDK